MLTNLQIRLETEKNDRIVPQMSSSMHGILMEHISSQYAGELHSDGFHPYSQYLSFEDDNVFWNINTLNVEAYQNIIEPMLNTECQMLSLKKHDIVLKAGEKKMIQITERQMAEEFYNGNSSRYIKLRFLTPTAFKQRGKYTFYPDLRCIYQSLMMKYDTVMKNGIYFDEDVLEQLVEDSSIAKYNLRSTVFHLEGVKIPSFVGWILIKLSGTQTLANYINLLFQFGEYSGIGIKTGIGMGAVRVEKRENGKRG